jgi:hypothetical protein
MNTKNVTPTPNITLPLGTKVRMSTAGLQYYTNLTSIYNNSVVGVNTLTRIDFIEAKNQFIAVQGIGEVVDGYREAGDKNTDPLIRFTHHNNGTPYIFEAFFSINDIVVIPPYLM